MLKKSKFSFTGILFSIIILNIACSDVVTQKDDNLKGRDNLPREKDTVKPIGTAFDFYGQCKRTHSWIGYLQGVEENFPGRGPFGRGSCVNGKNSFDLVFKLKDQFSIDQLDEKYEQGEANGYSDFLIYKFEIPNDDNYVEDSHGDPTIYPSLVKAYKKDNAAWAAIAERKVANLTEYTKFIIECLASHR